MEQIDRRDMFTATVVDILSKGGFPRLYDSEGNEVGMKEVCLWWVHTYPADIFVKSPEDVVKARECMERLLKKMEAKKK
jgi:hypothetical protein